MGLDLGELCHTVADCELLSCSRWVDDAIESVECVGELPGAACPGDGDGDVC